VENNDQLTRKKMNGANELVTSCTAYAIHHS
jgi:hypothetical protein